MPNPVPVGAIPIPGVNAEPGVAPVVLPPVLEFGVPPKVGLVVGVVLPPVGVVLPPLELDGYTQPEAPVGAVGDTVAVPAKSQLPEVCPFLW